MSERLLWTDLLTAHAHRREDNERMTMEQALRQGRAMRRCAHCGKFDWDIYTNERERTRAVCRHCYLGVIHQMEVEEVLLSMTPEQRTHVALEHLPDLPISHRFWMCYQPLGNDVIEA